MAILADARAVGSIQSRTGGAQIVARPHDATGRPGASHRPRGPGRLSAGLATPGAGGRPRSRGWCG